MSDIEDLGVIIPVRGEAKRLKPLTCEISKALAAAGLDAIKFDINGHIWHNVKLAKQRFNMTRSSPIMEEMVMTVNCAKCGKEIPAGQEVKKGFLRKKSYHKECAPK